MTIKEIKDIQYLSDLVDLHQAIYNDSFLENRFIYYDPAFRNYLTQIIVEANNGHWIYGLFEEQALIGFIHLRQLESILFLNNISIKSEHKGRGYGNAFLFHVLQNFNVSSLSKFQLDVFGKNTVAKNWYLKLGMEKISSKFWYLISLDLHENKKTVSGEIVKKPDRIGFESLFYKDVKIATVINKNIILHDYTFLPKVASLFKEDILYIQSATELSETNHRLMDTSLLLEGDIQIILRNLNK